MPPPAAKSKPEESLLQSVLHGAGWAADKISSFLENREVQAFLDALDRVSAQTPPGPWSLPLLGTVWAAKGAKQAPQMIRFLNKVLETLQSGRKMSSALTVPERLMTAYWLTRRPVTAKNLTRVATTGDMDILTRVLIQPKVPQGTRAFLLWSRATEKANEAAKAFQQAGRAIPKEKLPPTIGKIYLAPTGRKIAARSPEVLADYLGHEGMHVLQRRKFLTRSKFDPKLAGDLPELTYYQQPLERQAFRAGAIGHQDFDRFVSALTSLMEKGEIPAGPLYDLGVEFRKLRLPPYVPPPRGEITSLNKQLPETLFQP